MKITLKCDKCGKIECLYTRIETQITCSCGELMRRVYNIASDQSSTLTERKCNIFNVNNLPNIEEEMKKRNEEHFWEVVVPDLVKSGKYSIKEMLQNDWIYYDEKGHIQIQNKPPHKR